MGSIVAEEAGMEAEMEGSGAGGKRLAEDCDLLTDAFRERAFGPAHHQSATRTAAHMGPESDGTTTTRQGNRASTREKRVQRR
jgi:hypothetical protein